MKKLIVLDGNSILNRAYYGIRALSTSDGLPTNAVYGFITTIKRYMDALCAEYAVCAFDMSAPTFRHKKYDKYKSNRKGMPDELAVQLPYAKRAAEALGFKILETPGYEADDIIGTVCRSADAKGDIFSYIITGDRDSLQLITDTSSVYLLRNREDELFDVKHFKEVYTVTPDLFVDVKALMGDSSDCIPGVAGIGEKTAVKLIAASGGLDNLYDNAENGYFGASASVCAKLTSGKDSAYLSRDLAKICTDAPLGKDIQSYRTEGIDPERLGELFEELQFEKLAEKFHISKNGLQKSAQTDSEAKFEISEISPEDFFNTNIPRPCAVSFDDGTLSFYNDGTIYYLKKPSKKALEYFFSEPVICHDYKSLCASLTEYGITPECSFDTMLAAYLLEPGKSVYPLNDIAQKYGVPYNHEYKNAPSVIKSCHDVLSRLLDEQAMTDLLRNIEIPLAGILAEMERYGFKTDRQGIIDYANSLKKEEDKLADSIYTLAGHDFNINSPKQLGQVIFEELGLPIMKKTKTGYSTDAETLEHLKFYNPIVSEILNYRQIAKLRSTYGETLAAMADENDRIHTKLNQCGTATGRLSSNEPNLQNIPVRGELGREIRKYFIAENSNYILIDADYSQIELRLLAHLSQDKTMIEAFNSNADIHTITASQIFGISEENITKDLRMRAKAVNFGIVYGIGAFSLAQDLGISRKQADDYIKNYLATYPDVDKYLKTTVENAVQDGYTTTMFGRRRYIPELKSKNRNIAAFGKRVAMNSPIQGSAADIIKIAMIGVDRALKKSGIDARLIMQVHDELIVEAAENCADEASSILLSEMQNAVQLRVPLIAEVSRGQNWFDAK